MYHLYVTHVDDRERVQRELTERGIQTGIHYPIPIHLQPAYRELERGERSFPVTERLAGTLLSLPMFPELTAEQVRYVVDSLAAVARPALQQNVTAA